MARFYSRLLGWPIVKEEPDWVSIKPNDGVAYMSFQTEEIYEPPVWPAEPGKQQMMLHLDLEVGDLERAVEAAVGAGATLPEFQPQEGVRVLLDPAGHPFCLYVDPSATVESTPLP